MIIFGIMTKIWFVDEAEEYWIENVDKKGILMAFQRKMRVWESEREREKIMQAKEWSFNFLFRKSYRREIMSNAEC